MIKRKSKFLLAEFERELGAKHGLLQTHHAHTITHANKPFDWHKIITLDKNIIGDNRKAVETVLDDMASDEHGIKILKKIAEKVGPNGSFSLAGNEASTTGTVKGDKAFVLDINFGECGNTFYYSDELKSFYKASFNHILSHELVHFANSDEIKPKDNGQLHDQEAVAVLDSDDYTQKFNEPKRSKAYLFTGSRDNTFWKNLIDKIAYSNPPEAGLMVLSSKKGDMYDRKNISDQNERNTYYLNFHTQKCAHNADQNDPFLTGENGAKFLGDAYQIIKQLDDASIPLLVKNLQENDKKLVNAILHEKDIKLEGESLTSLYLVINSLAKNESHINPVLFETHLHDFYASLPDDMQQKVQKDINPFLGK